MRKFVISLAAAGTALAFATPASAQIFGNIGVGVGTPSYGYGYGQPYGYGYNGYGYNNYGQVRMLQARIDRVKYRIDQLSRYNGGGRTERLREESRNIEHRLFHAAHSGGLNPYEANDISYRISRLEQRVNYAMANRYRGYGYGYNGYGYNGAYGQFVDRDHDGDDDRYEHEQWHAEHDGDRDDDGDD